MALAKGETPPASWHTRSTTAQKQVRRSLTPVAVTKDNINDTIVKDGFWTTKQICTGKYAADCKAAASSRSRSEEWGRSFWGALILISLGRSPE